MEKSGYYDLRYEPWIPFRRRSGEIVWGAPSLLTEGLTSDNPITDIAAPRPDFNAALQEFLIGLLAVTFAPQDDDEWLELWNEPPDEARHRQALERLPDAFYLLGKGPRFFQDLNEDDLSADVDGVDGLLIDSAGEQGKRLNKDLFVKRDRFKSFGRPAAAMALLTLQTYAPAGGQGHRVSLRGGGPLTTLVDPRVAIDPAGSAFSMPLWQKLCANVPTEMQFRRSKSAAKSEYEKIFPWLAPTRSSKDKAAADTLPQHGHPLQCFFGMPKRIRLESVRQEGVCSLTGYPGAEMIIGYRSTNYGVKYTGWRHPLSPYYKDPEGSFLPKHPKSGTLLWKEWLSLMLRDPDERFAPAQCVSNFLGVRGPLIRVRRFRLSVLGYETDNAKACSWLQADVPAFSFPAKKSDLVWRVMNALTSATDIAAQATVRSVKEGLIGERKGVKIDLGLVSRAVWGGTEAHFKSVLERLSADDLPEDAEIAIPQGFVEPLKLVALSAFDEACPLEGIEHAAVKRVVAARYTLSGTLRGVTADGRRLFEALKLAVPDTAKGKKQSKKKGV
ncbi:MAG: type I-E CRISPR-associated protein Cse1/CasA [Pseudomonadota bacterium]